MSSDKKPLTFDDLARGQQKLQESQQKTEASQRKTEESLRELKEFLRESQRKTEESLRKTEESQRKTEESLRESHQKTEESHRKTKEGQRRLQESLGELKESQLKTEAALRKTDEFANRTLEAINKASGDFRNKWGRFMQNLVRGDFDKLLRSRGIEVSETHQTIKIKRADGSIKWEYDLKAVNGREVVFAEVKTNLTSEDVDHLLEKLADLKSCTESYRDKTVYGAVAYLDEDGAAKYAQNHGLFTIEALGAKEVATLTNPEDFVPRKF